MASLPKPLAASLLSTAVAFSHALVGPEPKVDATGSGALSMSTSGRHSGRSYLVLSEGMSDWRVAAALASHPAGSLQGKPRRRSKVAALARWRDAARSAKRVATEVSNKKGVRALDIENALSLGRFGFLFGLTMWRVSLGPSILGGRDMPSNSAKALSLVSTLSAQLLTVVGIYAIVLSFMLKAIAGNWEKARHDVRKQAKERALVEILQAVEKQRRQRYPWQLDEDELAKVPRATRFLALETNGAVELLDTREKEFLSDEERAGEKRSKQILNERVAVSPQKILVLLTSSFVASFLLLSALAYSNTLFSRRICAERFGMEFHSYSEWASSTRYRGSALAVELPRSRAMRCVIAPLWRLVLMPRSLVQGMGKAYAKTPVLVYFHESIEAWSGLGMFAVAAFLLYFDYLKFADGLVAAKKAMGYYKDEDEIRGDQ